MRRLFIVLGLTGAVLLAALQFGSQAQTAPADIILINGKIITVDARDSIAQAVAVSAGKIAAVGSNEQIRARVGPRTEVIDLQGRTATPGLIDSHVHFQEVDALYSVDLADLSIKKMDDVLAR